MKIGDYSFIERLKNMNYILIEDLEKVKDLNNQYGENYNYYHISPDNKELWGSVENKKKNMAKLIHLS